MHRYLKRIVFFLFIFTIQIQAESDIKIISSDQQKLVLEWELKEFSINEISSGQETFQQISFYEAAGSYEIGQPDVPQRALTLGIPSGGNVSVQILYKESETLPNINLAPVFTPERDKNGVGGYQIIKDPLYYSRNENFPQTIFSISETAQFRDIPTQQIILHPVQYNPVTRSLTYYKKIRLQVTYSNPGKVYTTFKSRGKLDKLYEKMMINFGQAQHWQLPKDISLSKVISLPQGTWYRIPVNEDGLFKISKSALTSAGMDVDNLNLQHLQMFNNGGHMLNFLTNATENNPAYTTEIPIMVMDQNQNNVLEDNDYILFYGKATSGWFYSGSANDFTYQQHLYSNTNYYWIALGTNTGLRMEEQLISEQSGAVQADYYMERLHLEEDKYNLLASGPDWYGNRFFGISDSYSLNFEADPDFSSGQTAQVKVKFKGGSAVQHGVPIGFNYTFAATINNHTLFTNKNFIDASTMQLNINVLSSHLNSGQNTLNIQYSGNLDGCIAYLDWFEIYYPHNLQAEENQLKFYTTNSQTAMRYTVSNLSAVNDIFMFDVSDPVSPLILAKNLSVSAGNITFDLPAGGKTQNIIISSLSSAQINNVTTLTPVTRGQDLISNANQADFLIITHKTFLPYARQIAEMRPHLKSKVISMEEIYFEFNAGVPDPTALRNFIRYAYHNWQSDAPSYVLLFGDGHYDYRNISLSDTMRVPTFEIFDLTEVDSRATDNYFVDLEMTREDLRVIDPDLAIGRIPIESTIDAKRYLQKLQTYENNPARDGWQTNLTFVADDQITSSTKITEWLHQNDLDAIANLTGMKKFIHNKIYLSTYPSEPGGFGRIKPKAADDLIDVINQGTLLVNYMGHGSPTQWAHEGVFVMSRDLDRINNPGKPFFLIAATCDFGKFDDPEEVSFNEALIWKEESGTIGALASSRLVYSPGNNRLNSSFLRNLFPVNQPSRTIGEAKLIATEPGVNDQKFILFADPTMHLADPRENIEFVTDLSDSLKALSLIEISAKVLTESSFNGEAIIIVNDATYDNVNTGDGFNLITLSGPLLFKGRVTVNNGILNGKFIVPKTIRYVKKKTGRITLYAWDKQSNQSAIGYKDQLLFNGSLSNVTDNEGPEINIYFQDQEEFSSGDLVLPNPVLKADVRDDMGINITGAAGHTINININSDAPKNISGFFTYFEDSYTDGQITYSLDELKSGKHTLTLTAFDNLNNVSEQTIDFNISASSELVVTEVVNYPNPFQDETRFTFQTNRQGAEVTLKIYTISGRLIHKLYGFSEVGYNEEIHWDGRDQDGDLVANGIYLYKLILKDGNQKSETIEKMVITR